MNALGRGLASLIPNRKVEDPDELIEEAEAETSSQPEEANEESEEVAVKLNVKKEESVDVEVVPKDQVEELELDPEVTDEKVAETSDDEESVKSVLDDFSELDGEDDQMDMPSAPKVTPLTIDPETGKLDLAPSASESETLPEVEEAKKNDETEERVMQVAVTNIEVNPLQPRKEFDEDDLKELMQSLDQHGMMQPMVVMEVDGGYQIIAGERRWRSAKRLNWKTVPCIVRSGIKGDRNRLELALTENVQRQNLNPIEEALGYMQLSQEYGMTHDEIGDRVGKSRVAVTNMLRLLQLPKDIQQGLIDEKITVGHARAILMIPDEEKQLRFYQHVVDEGLTVRKAENRARNIQRSMKLSDPLRKKTRGRPQLALKYDGLLEEQYGHNARVKFNSTKNRFEIVFHAFNEAEAEDLISQLLGVEEEEPSSE